MIKAKVHSEGLADDFNKELDLIETERQNFKDFFTLKGRESSAEQQHIISSLSRSIQDFKEMFPEWKNFYDKFSNTQKIEPEEHALFLELNQKIITTYAQMQSFRIDMNSILEHSLENNLRFKK